MNRLLDKIERSVALLRKGKKLALLMQPKHGYYIGFSETKTTIQQSV
jgi:hypothetical protein